jgi:hypothetical protein
MPIFDFTCPKGHTTEKVFLTFKEAEETDFIDCPKCKNKAGKQLGIPFPAHLHGSPEGYYKPSPAAKRVVNPDTCSYEGKGIVKPG